LAGAFGVFDHGEEGVLGVVRVVGMHLQSLDDIRRHRRPFCWRICPFAS
jgi:hypothetical protein